MPMRPNRVCSCGRVVASGVRCACQIARRAEIDRQLPNASQRGYDGAWQKARFEYLASHPNCVRCGKPATVVNHKIPHKGDRKLFWQKSNWEPVCKSCHDGPIQSAERRAL